MQLSIMPEILEKNDFIEIEFTGRVKDGEIFDTNIKEEAKKIQIELETRPLVICLGQSMILPAIDEFLAGKETEKDYVLELLPEKAFGLRDFSMIKIMPISVFLKQNVNPYPGMVFAFDNMPGKITSVTGGRVRVDFNNPLAGKEVVYHIKVKNKIKDESEKAKSLIFYLFRKEIPFKIENKKLHIEAEKKLAGFIRLFNDKFKEILNLELEIKEVENPTQEGQKEKSLEEEIESKAE